MGKGYWMNFVQNYLLGPAVFKWVMIPHHTFSVNISLPSILAETYFMQFLRKFLGVTIISKFLKQPLFRHSITKGVQINITQHISSYRYEGNLIELCRFTQFTSEYRSLITEAFFCHFHKSFHTIKFMTWMRKKR